MKRNLKKVLEGKAKKVSTNWYFEKKFKKRTSIERISILNWRVRLIRTLKLKLIIKKKKKKNSGNVFLQSCENIIPNWELEWSVATGYWILDPYGIPFWILMLHTIKFPVHYNINSDR